MKINYILALSFAFSYFSITPFIGSAYRLEIAGLGTIILLGDQKESRPETDQEQFEQLTQFLKRLASKGIQAVVNLETLRTGPEYYTGHDSRNSMVRNRLSEREIAPSLRSLVSTLQDSELTQKIVFTSSDLKRSELWDISRAEVVKKLTQKALKKEQKNEQLTFGSLCEDRETILQKFERFKERSRLHLPPPLYVALHRRMEERLNAAKKAHKTITAFWHKYADCAKSLEQQTIYDLITQFAAVKIGPTAIHFDQYAPSVQHTTINLVAENFLKSFGTPFKTEYASNLLYTPWIMDVFNAFTHHKAKTAVVYASDSHIHSITLFLRALANDLQPNAISFKAEYVLVDEPLSREQFENVLGNV